MDAVHIHLVVNHTPVILVASSLVLLFISVFNKKPDYRTIAFSGLLIAAIFSVVAFESGGDA